MKKIGLAAMTALVLAFSLSIPAPAEETASEKEISEEKTIQNRHFASWLKALELEVNFHLPKLREHLEKTGHETDGAGLKKKITGEWLPILKKHGKAVKNQISMIKDFMKRPDIVSDAEISAGIYKYYPEALNKGMNKTLKEIDDAGLFPDFETPNTAAKTHGIKELIKSHQKMRPGLEIQDIYKLLYQSVFGPEHLLNPGAESDLEKEFAALTDEPSTAEPLVENISADAEVVRINLRLFKKNNLSLEKLWAVMVISERDLRPRANAEGFEKTWEEFKKLISEKELNLNPAELETFDKMINAAKKTTDAYPTVHHSGKYRQDYKPAYRVVKNSVFREYFPGVD